MSVLYPRLDILEEKPVAVFGLGRSGMAVLKSLHDKIEIYASDDDAQKRNAAQEYQVTITAFMPEILKKCAFLVLSPGIDFTHPVYALAQEAGLEVICDIELFHRLYPDVKTIGITGTNGKSTTTALLAHILNENGLRAEMAGNIGRAIFNCVADDDIWMVLELSSYQLDLCPTFRPGIGILLNVSPDHLDRHGDMHSYVNAKAKILQGRGRKIVGIDDAYAAALLPAEGYGISVHMPVPRGAYIQEGVIFDMMQDKARKVGSAENIPALRGVHNQQNLLAAYGAARLCGLGAEKILQAARTFPGLAHRQYPVARIGNVNFINDSKATNGEATAKALAAYDNIYWIAGGRAKEGGLSGLEIFKNKIRKSYLMGEAAEEFSEWMKMHGMIYEICSTLQKAVLAAAADAKEVGGPAVVLLSPACASWDQYESFEARGEEFVKLVHILAERDAA